MNEEYFVYPSDNYEFSQIVQKIEQAYYQIEDEVSRKIYINRILFSLTSDLQYIRNIVLSTQLGKEFNRKLDEISSKPLLVYGAGKRGTQLIKLFPDKNWSGFIDKQKRGFINNLEIKTLEEYTFVKESVIIISNQFDYQNIKQELMDKGINENNLIVLEIWNNKARREQYFEKRCIDINKIQGGFVDAGSFDGRDSLHFNEYKDNSYKMWLFEPDHIQYEVCKQIFSHYNMAEVYNIALSDKTLKAKISGYKEGSYIKSDFAIEGADISTALLDQLLINENIGYIKMDIEGYEKKALFGCKNIIKEKKPKIAVSVYHKREDIFEIPSILLDFNPDYNFALGHYSIAQVDSVLYAF